MNAEVAPGRLTPEALREFRILLKDRYRALWQEIGGELANADLEPYLQTAGETHDAGDEGAADVAVDVNLAAVHRDILELRDIHAALGRIAWGRYGICADCHDDIELARLRAYPTAKRCRPCQQRHERRFAHEPTPSL